MGKALIDGRNDNDQIIATYLGNYQIQDTDKAIYRKLDILDKDGYRKLFEEFLPGIVIHTASIGSPDYAQQHKEETWKVNVLGTQNIVDCCKRFNVKLIYISSNGIYDGDRAPYSEDDLAKPINYYGQTKLEGERIAMKANIPFAILRPILVYGWNYPFERPNIVTQALFKLKNSQKVYVYDDVYVNPLFAPACAEAIWMIINKEKYEPFNIAGKERMSIYELIKTAADIFNVGANNIIPVKQGFFNELVKRPKDTSYNTEKMQKVLGINPLSVYEGLTSMKDSQLKNE